MRITRILALVLLLLAIFVWRDSLEETLQKFLLNLGPGGGGTVHIPPDGISSEVATPLTISFSTWGAGSGRLDQRYTGVVCWYRINEGPENKLEGLVLSADESHMEMKFVIPPLDLKPGDQVSYRFEMLFDGHRNARDGGTLQAK